MLHTNLTRCIEDAPSSSPIIAKGVWYKDPITNVKNVIRNYTHYSNWIEVWTMIQKYSSNERNFHEIIRSNKGCKLFADIDIEKDSDWILEKVLTEFIKCMKEIFTEYKAAWDPNYLFIFINAKTSKNYGESPCPSKQSIHLVYNKWALQSIFIVRYIIKKIVAKMENYANYIDIGVYKENQSFRLPYCTKLEASNSHMLPVTTHMIDGKKVQIPNTCKDIDIFISGVITAALPKIIYIDIPTAHHKHTNFIPENWIPVIKKLKAYIGDECEAFQYTVENGFIKLNRLKPSTCSICKRDHQNENQYAYVVDDKGRKTLRYGCYRNVQFVNIMLEDDSKFFVT